MVGAQTRPETSAATTTAAEYRTEDVILQDPQEQPKERRIPKVREKRTESREEALPIQGGSKKQRLKENLEEGDPAAMETETAEKEDTTVRDGE